MNENKHGYLIDMDGVVYRGGELIQGADTFINNLIDQDVPFLFITNNSQRTRRDIATRLQRLGIRAREENIYTCAEATAQYLAIQKPGGTAFVIGEGGLLTSLHEQGFSIVENDPDFVVVGECRTFNAEAIEHALNLILKGASFVATNLDANCPTRNGTRPGCGALVSMLEKASGLSAFSVGKPSPVMMRGARKTLGLRASETIMIGDTMETDILGGVQLGYYSILVLTGSTTLDSMKRYAFSPNEVVSSIGVIDDNNIASIMSKRVSEVSDCDSEFIVMEP